jgi:16S rRNA (guanine527-N7)-methyltransferase
VELLLKWQRSQRLIGSADRDWIIDHIVLDSLLFVRMLPPHVDRVLDVGSGAGVPGIPLKIVLPATTFTLLEARAKRVSFLLAVVRELELGGCEVLNGRLETIADVRAPDYDAIVMRCAGAPAELKQTALRLLRPGGLMVATGPPSRRAMSGPEWRQVNGPAGTRSFWIAQQS